MDNKDEAEEARKEFDGYKWKENDSKRLKVEWAKGDGLVKRYINNI